MKRLHFTLAVAFGLVLSGMPAALAHEESREGCAKVAESGAGDIVINSTTISFVEDPAGVVTWNVEPGITGTVELYAGGGFIEYDYADGTGTTPVNTGGNNQGQPKDLSHIHYCLTVVGAQGSPTPTATPTPTPTPTPSTEPTVEPEGSPDPTPTPTPTPSAEPTVDPQGSPDPTPTPDPTLDPLGSLDPSDDPGAGGLGDPDDLAAAAPADPGVAPTSFADTGAMQAALPGLLLMLAGLYTFRRWQQA